MTLTATQLQADIQRAVSAALAEDVGTGDITAELIPAHARARASVITREDCVVCGAPWFNAVFAQLGDVDEPRWQASEGQAVAAGSTLVTLAGSARKLLTGERTALNFLQLLCGTATTSRTMAQLVADTELSILDTRKTVPGLRTAQKYAVTMGGCTNHRIGLYDAFLIKENHILACGSITAAVQRAQKLHPDKPVIVEVENYVEYCEAADLQVHRIMLDELSEVDLARVLDHPSPVPIEVSGNIDAENIRRLAGNKIQAISSGALTKHIRAIDLSLRLEQDS